MYRKTSIIEIVFTVIILIVACVGIGLTVVKPVRKNSGELTVQNYTDYMQVTCSSNFSAGDGVNMWYYYRVTITADIRYRLENVTVSFVLGNKQDTVTASLEAGESYVHKCSGSYTQKDLEITVKSVKGTYKYTV